MRTLPKDIEKRLRTESAQIDPKFQRALKQQLFKETPMNTSKVAGFFSEVRKHKFAPLGATLIAVMVVGSGSALVTNNRARLAREQEIQLPSNLEDVLSIGDLQAQVASELPDSVITGIELETEDGILRYKVKFSDGSFRLYDAKTGVRVTEPALEVDATVPTGFVAGITLQQARTIAQNQRPGKTITKIELETENAVVVYSVRFSDDGRVDVNASNGSVVRVRGADGEKISGDDSTSSAASDNSSSDDDSNSSRSGSDDSNDDSGDDDNSGSGRSGSGSNSGSGDDSDDNDSDDNSDDKGRGSDDD